MTTVVDGELGLEPAIKKIKVNLSQGQWATIQGHSRAEEDAKAKCIFLCSSFQSRDLLGGLIGFRTATEKSKRKKETEKESKQQ